MKRLCLYVFGITVAGLSFSEIQATILFRNSASNITSGTLNPARVNPSTFTMLGPNPSLQSISGAIGSSQIIAGATLMSVFENGDPIGNVNTVNCVGATNIDCNVSGSPLAVIVSTPSASSITGAIGSSQTTSGFTKMSVFDEGVPGGNINSLNLVGDPISVTVSGTTGTLTVTATPPRIYDLYAAPPGHPGFADTRVNETNSFIAMFGSAPINARGLTTGTTVHGTIFLSTGIYEVNGATIPQGITVYCTPGSSTVIRPTSNTGTPLYIYGKLVGCTLDFGGRPFASDGIWVGTNAYIDDSVFITGVHGADQTGSNTWSLFRHQYATNTYVGAKVDHYAGAVGDANRGGLVSIDYGNNCRINLKAKMGVQGATSRESIFVRNSSFTYIDGTYDNVGGRFIRLQENNRDTYISGTYNLEQAMANQFLLARPGNGATIAPSSVTVLENIKINVYLSGAPTPLYIFGDGGGTNQGVTIRNCIVRYFGTSGAPANFININDTGVTRAYITNNHTFNVPFISDTGAGTSYTSNDNSTNGVEP